ncbi:MAG: hypothetical protein HQ582_21615 [Planctomycetes bacterium]|nr:hypothetical protein [Planctomycetota bacterium]
MKKRILSIAAACLLLAGCNSMGRPLPGLAGMPKLWPGRGESASSRQSFIEAVENDPFPRAGQADRMDLKVATRR